MQFSSIWPIDRTLSGATTPGQSGPGSDGNEGLLHIPQSSSITGTSPSDCLVISKTLVEGGGVLPFCRGAVSVFYSPNQVGNTQLNVKTVLFQIIQFSISTQFKYQNSSISSNSV